MEDFESGRPTSEQPAFSAPERIGASLGIAPEHHQHPVVREFTGFIDQVEQLQQHFDEAAERGLARHEPQPSPSERRPLPQELDVSPSLRERYGSAELMLRALTFILRDGSAGASPIQDDPNRQRYLMSKLNSALGSYGLEVVPQIKPPLPNTNRTNPRAHLKVVK